MRILTEPWNYDSNGEDSIQDLGSAVFSALSLGCHQLIWIKVWQHLTDVVFFEAQAVKRIINERGRYCVLPIAFKRCAGPWVLSGMNALPLLCTETYCKRLNDRDLRSPASLTGWLAGCWYCCSVFIVQSLCEWSLWMKTRMAKRREGICMSSQPCSSTEIYKKLKPFIFRR